MRVHKNSTPTEGVFKGLTQVKSGLETDFPISDAQKQKISSLLAECMITEIMLMLEESDAGEITFFNKKHAAIGGSFDLGVYYDRLIESFDGKIRKKLKFTSKQINSIVLHVKISFFLLFKKTFCDSRGSKIICYGNQVKPTTQPYDFRELLESSIEFFFTFI